MTAFGGALTDPTKIMGSRIGAFVIDFILTSVVIGGVLFQFGLSHLDEVPAGSDQAAQQICDTITGRSDGSIDDAPSSSASACFVWDSTAHVATDEDAQAIELQYWGTLAGFTFLNWVLLTVVTGGTVGKLIFGLRVVTARGQRAGFGRNLVRWAFLVIDVACCFLPGLITSLNTKGHRRIGDLVAGTYVVHRSAEGRLLHIPGHLHVKNRHEYGSFGPAPAGIEPTLGSGGGIDAPVFDPSRNTYVRYDQASGVWFQWDDAAQAWVPAQQ